MEHWYYNSSIFDSLIITAHICNPDKNITAYLKLFLINSCLIVISFIIFPFSIWMHSD